MSKELNRMQKLAGVPAKKESLNEHQIGGIVGVGAINQIPPRDKTDYEMAFEYFMNEGEEKEVEEGMFDKIKSAVGMETDKEKYSIGDIVTFPEIDGNARPTGKNISDEIVELLGKWHGKQVYRTKLDKILHHGEILGLEDEITGTDIGDLDTSSSVPDFGDDEITGTSLE